MKKTLSLFLAICMMVTLVAIPAMAETTTEMAYTPVAFDLDSYDVDSVISSNMLSGNPVLKYTGTSALADADVTYTKADGTQANLSNCR